MKVPFAILALTGGTLILISAYFQLGSMDLNRFTLSQYIAADVPTYVWWTGIALPFFIGLSLLLIATACIRLRPTRQATIRVLVGCLGAAMLLCVFNTWLGVYAVLPVVAALIAAMFDQSIRSLDS